MSALNKMLFRDIRKSKGQFIAAASVIFVGIVMFAASFASYKDLNDSVNKYYNDYSFLDYFCKVQGITEEGLEEVKAVDGVKNAEGRSTIDVAAVMTEDSRVTLRMISVPDNNPPAINKLYFNKGGYFKGDKSNQCFLNKSFADYHKLKIGDSINISILSKKYTFEVAGVVQSPEYIYAVKSATSPTPSPETFGILYVKEGDMKSVLGRDLKYNEVHVLFNDNKKNNTKKIEKVLKEYGVYNGTLRKDQVSNTMIVNEVNELKEIAVMFPVLFLFIAAMIIYIMQRRIINNQRTLIGIMKAMGFTKRRILLHYILNSLLISLAGSLPGVLGGYILGLCMTNMYTSIFSIPIMDAKIYPEIFFIAIGISAFACILAGYNGAKRITKIEPAEAMRPETPSMGKKIFLEKNKKLWNRLPFRWKVSVRNIFRNPQRTFATILGTVITIMFFMVTLFFIDSISYIVKQHFNTFQTQDYKIIFNKALSESEAMEIGSIEGVKKAETIAEVPCEVYFGDKKEESMLVATNKNSNFYHLQNENKESREIADSGVLIAEALSEKLNVAVGDELTFKLYGSKMIEKKIKVVGLVKQYAGFNCFVSKDQLSKAMEKENMATAALISTSKISDKSIKRTLNNRPYVEVIESREKAMKDFNALIEFFYVFMGIMVAFGGVMGFSIIFNTTVINVMERRRELASLKVMGFKRREIEGAIFRENMLMALLAIAPGVIAGKIMADFFAKHFSNELFRFEVIINPTTYIVTFISVFLFIVLSQLANRKSIVGLDMVEVLKSRE